LTAAYCRARFATIFASFPRTGSQLSSARQGRIQDRDDGLRLAAASLLGLALYALLLL